jgi:hypothetical protein
MDINNLVDEFIQERFENVSLEQFASPKKWLVLFNDSSRLCGE